MCWNGHAVYDCATEFRLFWLQSKLAEVGADGLSQGNTRRFLPLPCWPATPVSSHENTRHANPSRKPPSRVDSL